MTCIYKITSPTDKVYIGQTANFEYRMGTYGRLHCQNQPKLYNSLQKHGWDAHNTEVLFELRDDINPEMLTYWEQFFMDYYRDLGHNLLNLREAGNRGKFSDETRKKISKSTLGRKLSSDHRQRLYDMNRGETHPRFKGFVLAYKNNDCVGRYIGCHDAANHFGIAPSSVWRSIVEKRALPKIGYQFVREPLTP